LALGSQTETVTVLTRLVPPVGVKAILSDTVSFPARSSAGLTVQTQLIPATTPGDPRLIEQLIANLLDNAIRHNVAAGWIKVTTATSDGHAVISIANTGPEVAANEVALLLQPFERLGTERIIGGTGPSRRTTPSPTNPAASGLAPRTSARVRQTGGWLDRAAPDEMRKHERTGAESL
jgi:light-regulated signal transduction histidine kinase (bacteriophytochrome)